MIQLCSLFSVSQQVRLFNIENNIQTIFCIYLASDQGKVQGSFVKALKTTRSKIIVSTQLCIIYHRFILKGIIILYKVCVVTTVTLSLESVKKIALCIKI